MKAIITFFLLFVSVLSYGQSEKYFDYRISKSSRSQVDSNYLVTPKFEVNPYKKGDMGLYNPKYPSAEYVRRFMNNVTIAVLKDTVEMLAYRSDKDSKSSQARAILYIDEEGNASKPFLLPQKDTDYYHRFMKSYNIPEFITGKVSSKIRALSTLAKEDKGIDVTYRK